LDKDGRGRNRTGFAALEQCWRIFSPKANEHTCEMTNFQKLTSRFTIEEIETYFKMQQSLDHWFAGKLASPRM
jgi:uncharacterized protein involved in tellurium resistance